MTRADLKPELLDTDEGKKQLTLIEIGKAIWRMEIAEDDGFAYFNDVLFVSLKNTFGYKLYG